MQHQEICERAGVHIFLKVNCSGWQEAHQQYVTGAGEDPGR